MNGFILHISMTGSWITGGYYETQVALM